MSELIDDSVYVCIDCFMDHHEGRPMKDNSAVDWTDNNTDENGDDKTIDFSSSRCRCCGTTIAGARYCMAVWE